MNAATEAASIYIVGHKDGTIGLNDLHLVGILQLKAHVAAGDSP